jgi:hypothetical protein
MKKEFIKWKCYGCGATFESVSTDADAPESNYCPNCIDKHCIQHIDGTWRRK